jgi:hypothetical protein
LTFDPSKRISVDEALAHPYLQDFDIEEAKLCESQFEYPPESETISELRDLIWKEIARYHPDLLLPEKQREDVAGEPPSLPRTVLEVGETSSDPDSSLPRPDRNNADGHRKRRRPEDTITPVKTHIHEASLFAQVTATVQEEKSDRAD